MCKIRKEKKRVEVCVTLLAVVNIPIILTRRESNIISLGVREQCVVILMISFVVLRCKTGIILAYVNSHNFGVNELSPKSDTKLSCIYYI